MVSTRMDCLARRTNAIHSGRQVLRRGVLVMLVQPLPIIPIGDRRSSRASVPEDPGYPTEQNLHLLLNRMKQADPSPKDLSGTGWHLLGKLELRIDENANYAVRAWITEIIDPLDLNMDFLNRVLRSAQDAVARATHGDLAESRFEHLHLFLFAPMEHKMLGRTWGFFRIEKIGMFTLKENSQDLSIEFYLYPEGH